MVSGDVVILTRVEFDVAQTRAFQRGYKRGLGERPVTEPVTERVLSPDKRYLKHLKSLKIGS